jgi:hypothetical protein
VLPIRSREIADSLGGALVRAALASAEAPPRTAALPELQEIAEPALESGGPR